MLDVLQGDRTRKHVDETENIDNDTVHSHTLRTSSCRQALDRVECLKWCVCERVDDVEEEVCGNCTTADLEVLCAYFHLGPACRQSAVDSKQYCANKGTDYEYLSAGHTVS